MQPCFFWVLKKAGDTQLSKLGIHCLLLPLLMQLFPFPTPKITSNGKSSSDSRIGSFCRYPRRGKSVALAFARQLTELALKGLFCASAPQTSVVETSELVSLKKCVNWRKNCLDCASCDPPTHLWGSGPTYLVNLEVKLWFSINFILLWVSVVSSKPNQT